MAETYITTKQSDWSWLRDENADKDWFTDTSDLSASKEYVHSKALVPSDLDSTSASGSSSRASRNRARSR